MGPGRLTWRWSPDTSEATRTVENPIGSLGAKHGPAGLRIRGWALYPETVVTRVDLFVDGETFGRARLGLPRADVSARYASPDAAICGFEAHLELSPESTPDGSVTVSARVHGVDGSSFELSHADVRLCEPEAPFIDANGDGRRLRHEVDRCAGGGTRRLDQPPRILAFTHDLELGGAQLYLLELIRRLVAEPGWSCALVTPVDGPLRARFERAGVPVHVVGDYGLSSMEAYEAKVGELATWAIGGDFNVVLANTVLGFAGVDLASRLGIPSVLSVHESVHFPRWSVENHTWADPHRYVRERIEWALGTACAVIFEADATRDQYAHCGDPSRFIAMPYAIELDEIGRYREHFDPGEARAALHLPEAADVLLCLGTFEPRKGQTALAQAFSMIADDHPSALLCMVGDRGDWYSLALREYIRRADLGDRVLLSPLVEDPYRWMGAADLLVCPSDRESLPRVVLEAMAFEKPVLATSVFGLSELICDGRTGHLCEPRDTGALSASLARVLARVEEHRTMGRAAAGMVHQRHDPDRYAGEIRALIAALVEDPAVAPGDVLRTEGLA